MPRQILIKVDQAMHDKVKLAARQHSLTMSAFVRMAIAEALDRSGGEGAPDLAGMVLAIYRRTVLDLDMNLPAAQAEAIDALTQMDFGAAKATKRVRAIARERPDAPCEELVAMALRRE